MPYYGNPTSVDQRNAIVQALMEVSNPQPRTQVPGAAQQNYGATRQPNVLGPPTPGSTGQGPTTASAGGIPGVPGQFNPAAASTPPAAGPMDPSGVQGPPSPGAFPILPAGGPVGRPLSPPQVMPQVGGGMPAPSGPIPQPSLLNSPAPPQQLGTQLQDPTRLY